MTGWWSELYWGTTIDWKKKKKNLRWETGVSKIKNSITQAEKKHSGRGKSCPVFGSWVTLEPQAPAEPQHSGSTNTIAGKHWPARAAIELQGAIWTTDVRVWKSGFGWVCKKDAAIPQNTASASHQALGYINTGSVSEREATEGEK